MGYYAIGIGGTGAKCLEALIHLAAAGMMPDDGNLYVLFVDSDTDNGNLDGAQQALTGYMNCKDSLNLVDGSLFQTNIVSADRTVWTPFEDKAEQSVGEFFTYNSLNASADRKLNAAARLFEVLYSKQERETTLEYGFRGRPSIGSAVMAKTVDLGETEPWGMFRQRIANDRAPKIFLAGSIFGGTGAAGFPTIARLISNKLREINAQEKATLGGALVLPYFHFVSQDNLELQAESEAFLMNTRAALQYYYLWNRTDDYKAVYLVGSETQTEVDYCLGGKGQRNAPHFIELYAALAAIHFFRDFEAENTTKYFVTARHAKDTLNWSDLPDGRNGGITMSKLGNMVRFAFSYLSVYQPMLKEIPANRKRYKAPWNADRDGNKASWYIDFFVRNRIRLDDEDTHRQLNLMENYCRAFLLWIANIQENSGESASIEFVNSAAYTTRDKNGNLTLKPVEDFGSRDFGNLIRTPDSQIEAPNALSKVWERMSSHSTKGGNRKAKDIGVFLNALYDSCDH